MSWALTQRTRGSRDDSNNRIRILSQNKRQNSQKQSATTNSLFGSTFGFWNLASSSHKGDMPPFSLMSDIDWYTKRTSLGCKIIWRWTTFHGTRAVCGCYAKQCFPWWKAQRKTILSKTKVHLIWSNFFETLLWHLWEIQSKHHNESHTVNYGRYLRGSSEVRCSGSYDNKIMATDPEFVTTLRQA